MLLFWIGQKANSMMTRGLNVHKTKTRTGPTHIEAQDEIQNEAF